MHPKRLPRKRPEPLSPPLIPKHGGFRRLKSFQLGELIYDLTVRFCDLYISSRSRTHDQMVQAARSGVQNIVEGSVASGTSKKTELKLTNVARASLEELRRDYEDYLRQRGEPLWPPDHPALLRFKARRCKTVEEVRAWIQDERRRAKERHGRDTDEQGRTRTAHGREDNVVNPCKSVPRQCQSASPASRASRKAPPSAICAANAALSLLNLCCYLLDRQIAAQAASFENEGGFTERLYKVRQARRRQG